MINIDRWRNGTATRGTALLGYRQHLVAHVGHAPGSPPDWRPQVTAG